MPTPTLRGHEPSSSPRPGAGGDATASHAFPATAASVGQARRFLLGQLPPESREDADALVLMLSELATNAVRHAATEYVVSVRVVDDGRRVLVEVSDAAAGYPMPQEQVGDAPHGRGLHIVRTLADAWGVDEQRDRPGKTVWFSSTLAARDDAPAGEDPPAAAAAAALGGGPRRASAAMESPSVRSPRSRPPPRPPGRSVTVRWV